jgi:Family of unknown function (DUF6364)
MVRLTVSLDEKVLEEAQRKAGQEGTSVPELVRSYLEAYAGDQPSGQRQAIRELIDLSLRVRSGSGGAKWTRDELHER